MKKIIFAICFLSMTFLIYSCTSDEAWSQNDFDNPSQSYALSENEVLSIVDSFQKGITEGSKTRGNLMDKYSYSIKKKYYISNPFSTRSISSDRGLVYEVVLSRGNNKGKALVSGDKRFPEILAYIPYCNDSVNMINSGASVMLQMAKSAFITEIENYNVEQKRGVQTRSTAIEQIPSQIYLEVYPLCKTSWDQWDPYTNAYPKNWVDIFFGMCSYTHYPAGCAVVALAQIMAAIEPNLTCAGLKMDWAYLKQNPVINGGPFGEIDDARKIDMVAALYKDIYDKTNSYPTWGTGETDEWPPQEVTCVTSVGTSSTNVYNYLNSVNGTTYCSSYQRWNMDVVKNSLINVRPVFVGGNGHAFVIDGYAVAKNPSSNSNNIYFHANFGWGGSSNGYYLTNSGSIAFETSNGNYADTQLSIISDIRKR